MVDIDIDAINTAYNQVIARITEVTLAVDPDYEVDGQKVSKGKYLEQLSKTAETLRQQIERYNATLPYEINHEIIT